MAVLLDVIILAIVIICIIRGRDAGFVRTVIELLGWIAIILLTSFIADKLAGIIYDTVFRESITTGVNDAVVQSGSQKLTSVVTDFFEGLPAIVSGALTTYDVTPENVVSTLANSNNASVISSAVADALRPPIVAFISLIISLLIFIGGIFAVRYIARSCNGIVARLPLISGLNRFLGAFTGCIKGITVSFLVVWIIAMAVVMNKGGFLGIDLDVINDSYLFSNINSINPIL